MIDRSLNYGRHHIANFLQHIGDYKIIVDLGAGGGDDLSIASQVISDAKLFAIEVYPPYIENLRQKGITVYSLNIERDKLPFENCSIDVIIMNQILEHVKEVFWIFHEISRVLKVGGSIIIGVPNIAALHNRVLLLFGRQPTQLKNFSAHVRGWSKRDMITFFKECFDGFVLRDFGGSNFYPFPPFVAKPLAAIFPNMAWGIFMRWEKQNDYINQFLEYPTKERLETNFYLGE